jgi:hypothetical protein
MSCRQIACGTSHTLVLTDSGDVFSFGSNRAGELGVCDWFPLGKDGAIKLKDQHAPHALDHGARFDPAESLKRQVPTSVACGAKHSALITEEGELFVWGSEQNGRLGLGENFVGTARDQAIALDAAGMDYEATSAGQATSSLRRSSVKGTLGWRARMARRRSASEKTSESSGEGMSSDNNLGYNTGNRSGRCLESSLVILIRIAFVMRGLLVDTCKQTSCVS